VGDGSQSCESPHRENVMARMHIKRSGGFTLIELMIVVAIIGILASIAIPSFINYQLTSKRAEAFANLASLAKSQKSYYAEFNSYVPVLSAPTGGGVPGPTTIKRDKTSIDAAFADVGWTPDGDVFFDYDTSTPADPMGGTCFCTDSCFTAAAYGDLDGDGLLSALIYAQPDAVGDYCTTGNQNLAPPLLNGSRAVSQVTRVIGADDF